VSWDIWFEVDLGGPKPLEVGESFNYTSNVGPMIDLCDKGFNFKYLDGKHAEILGACISVIINFLEDEANLEALTKLEPDNGWGSRVDFVSWLKKLNRQCLEMPKAVVRVWV